MNDWEKVRKNRLVRKCGTDSADEILQVFAPVWRKPFKAPASKTELREQAAEARREWQLRHPNGRSGPPASTRLLITSPATCCQFKRELVILLPLNASACLDGALKPICADELYSEMGNVRDE
jgi:hypothetical protein